MNELKYNFIEVTTCCPPKGQLWPLREYQHLIFTFLWKCDTRNGVHVPKYP